MVVQVKRVNFPVVLAVFGIKPEFAINLWFRLSILLAVKFTLCVNNFYGPCLASVVLQSAMFVRPSVFFRSSF